MVVLKKTRTDVWLLLPTGMIVNRMLDKACKLSHIEKLQSFFGLNESEIKEEFYTIEHHANLFGDEEGIVKKIQKPIDKISKVYAKQLKTIWRYVTESPSVLRLQKVFRFSILFLLRII